MTHDKPNIIFLMDDQHRWNALGCVNSLVKTPALDALASEGVRYEQAVCQAPACVPSRYSMMLGLYPSQIGVRRNGEFLSDDHMPLPTIAERLRDAGYETAGFGKMHWSDPGCSTRGFETRAIGQPRGSKLLEHGATMMSDVNPDGLAAYLREVESCGIGEENVAGYVGRTSEVAADDHRDGWVTQQCLEYLGSRRDDPRPLFLYLSYVKPHAALNVPVGFEDLYDMKKIPDMDNPDWSKDRPEHTQKSDLRMPFFRGASSVVRRRTILRYWANCSWIDSMIDQVLARLRETHTLDNALIIYLSDHGEMLGERYFRFSKYCLYEGSVRVPLILTGSALPSTMRGSIDQRPAELVDVMPTILEAAGIPAPTALPGRSLFSPPIRTGSFSEHHHAPFPAYMWRTDSAKLILYTVNPSGGHDASQSGYRGELYDLERDPGEWVNLYDNHNYSGLRESMTRDLVMHLCQSGSRYPHSDVLAK